MTTRSVRFLLLCPLLLILAGCGEGYEAIRVDNVFPYGNMRTAGSTIIYVRAKMMPEKQLKLESADKADPPVLQDWTPEDSAVPAEPVEETKEILNTIEDDMSKLFEKSLKK